MLHWSWIGLAEFWLLALRAGCCMQTATSQHEHRMKWQVCTASRSGSHFPPRVPVSEMWPPFLDFFPVHPWWMKAKWLHLLPNAAALLLYSWILKYAHHCFAQRQGEAWRSLLSCLVSRAREPKPRFLNMPIRALLQQLRKNKEGWTL